MRLVAVAVVVAVAVPVVLGTMRVRLRSELGYDQS